MREIRFRLWDTDNNTWYIKDTRTDSAVPLALMHDGKGNHFINTWLTVEQFTGLKDSKGKEIYEGDIVRYFDWCYCNTKVNKPGTNIISHPFENAYGDKWMDHYKPLVGVVKWNEQVSTYEPLVNAEEDHNNNCFAYVCCRKLRNDKNYPKSFITVIGNIHENGELLNKT